VSRWYRVEVSRFRNTVGICSIIRTTVRTGPGTAYLCPDEARTLARALVVLARDIEARQYQDSEIGSITIGDTGD